MNDAHAYEMQVQICEPNTWSVTPAAAARSLCIAWCCTSWSLTRRSSRSRDGDVLYLMDYDEEDILGYISNN
jgi:hypothetical protein